MLATRLKVGLSDTLGSMGDVPLSERFLFGRRGKRRYGLRRIGPLSLSNDPLGGLSLIRDRLSCVVLYSGSSTARCSSIVVRLRRNRMICGSTLSSVAMVRQRE